MKYVRYNKVYGESCFKALVVLVKNGIDELKITKIMLLDLEKDIDIEWRSEEKKQLQVYLRLLKKDIYSFVLYLNTPIKTLLKIDDRFLDIDEYEIYEWAYGIFKQVDQEIFKEMLEEEQETE